MPSGAARETETGFTSERAGRVMAAACRSAGLGSDGARLIRLGENALFRLAAHPVIVRVARSADYLSSVRTEVAVSRWLAGEGFPAARTVDDLDQPVIVAGHPVTFWHLIDEGDRKPTYGELGGLLRDLHATRLPAGLELPAYEVFGRTDLRIEKAAGIPEDDRRFLRERSRALRDRLAELRFESAKGPVHGDAHVQNLMVDRSGRTLIIDFENFSYDHPEWDLMVTATEHHSLGWQTPEQYAAFTGAYGRDLRDGEGFPVLRGIQEFKMTTWLMQNIAEGPAVAEEYARRIASLRNDDAPRHWQPG
ncbi:MULTISPECIES: phosphotransferase enzyme family protein [Streptomyces]|uniref:phosphotransferase enzyme family protein n=1 Tax=Streptomyces TaxID=1883 RepID=UPI0022491F54|nr:aminoglycoside phosphotransferase family protein [Streptomyces sp. JHD 1]MCX2969179.1 aminoglycoside phosphotransferase family protein [Streptomyces sp. JHD 1]